MKKAKAPQTATWAKPELNKLGEISDVAGKQGGPNQNGFKS